MQNYIGKQIDRYRIIERLGMGGMAVVYKAYDVRLEREVALKLIRTEAIPQEQHERLLKRFEREAKAQARFNHRHIVQVYDYGEVDGSPYLVMAYVNGGTLKERINGPVDYAQAVDWLLPIVEALTYAHQRGVVHRDVKPANILFDEDDQPMLLDFGIAKVLETEEMTLTGAGLGVGTPEYMAPEQWKGQACEATDQYALGVVLYELLTGEKPYSAETPAAVAIQQATEPLRPLSARVMGVPEALEKVLYKMLAKDPDDRFADMAALAAALKTVFEQSGGSLNENAPQTVRHVVAPAPVSEAETVDELEAPVITPVRPAVKEREKGKKRLPKWALWVGAGVIGMTLVGIVIVAVLVLGLFKGDGEKPVVTENPDAVEDVVDNSVDGKPSEESILPTKEAGVGDSAFRWADVDPAKEITFWHVYSGDLEVELLAIINDFNRTNGYGITLTAEYVGGYGDVMSKVLPLLQTDDVPDLIVSYQPQTATYYLSESVWDLNEIIDNETWGMSKKDQEDFFSGIFQQDVFANFDNVRLGLPASRAMEMLYYNKDWLNELGYEGPPTTPYEFNEMACAGAAYPFSGASAPGSMGYQLGVDASRFASWTFAFGGDIYDYNTGIFDYDNTGAIDAMTFLRGLFEEGCATFVTESYGDQNDFGAGRLLFTVASSSGIPYYQSSVDSGANFDWSVAAIPHTTADPVQNIYGASITIPKSTPERQLAAWLFLKYFTNPSVQAQWAEATGYLPVRAGAGDLMTTYFSANPAYAEAFALLEFGISEPAVVGYDFVREDVEDVMVDIVDDPDSDVDASLTRLNTSANDYLQYLLSDYD